ncbi:unnamed protein product [Parnassius mnemosyne]|uniref:PiggyBac transposable element-derived protein domain-containing protein n=1 Tax=Parnassius mnemosyne TaxID=213953 RepID=A0AAV1LAZ1_9NEOP
MKILCSHHHQEVSDTVLDLEHELQEDFDPSEIEDSDGSDADEDEWKKVAWSQNPVVSLFDSIQLQPVRNIANRTRPLVFFEMFFDSEAIDMIITQTNLYASQCNDQNCEQVSATEIKALLGMIIQMGIHKLPCIEDYWSSDPLLHVVQIAETMTLKRFQKLMKYLHLNDNANMPNRNDDNYDKLYKIRPLLDYINVKCQTNAKNTHSQSIDECMIKFKVRSTLKQYMSMKPIKRGFKVWARADSHSGYLYQFQVYAGKTENVETGLGSNVVMTLCQSLINETYMGHIAFDNFSSPALLQTLYNNCIYATATVKNDRQDMPLIIKKHKATGNKEIDEKIAKAVKNANQKTKKLKRGEWKWRVKNNVGFIIWKDNKLVSILSTAFHPKQKTSCERTQNDGSKKSFPCPLTIIEYTKRMGGVDRFDQKRTPYAVGRKSSKWWKRIFYFLIDAAITNAYILYASNIRNHTVLSQKEFRLTLSRELVANATFRKRPFATMPKFASKKSKSVQSEESESRQKKLFGVPREIRFSELGAHWPVELSTYRRCRLCSSAHNNQRSRIQCDRCQVPLCAVPCLKTKSTNIFVVGTMVKSRTTSYLVAGTQRVNNIKIR